MANNSSTFTLGIKTKVDSAELNRLKQQLQEIRSMMSDPAATSGLGLSQIREAIDASKKLEQALASAYDTKLNTLNVDKFNKSLKNSETNLQEIQKSLTQIGPVGQKAFTSLTADLFKFTKTARQTNAFLDEMAKTMTNTVRWSVTSSIVNNIAGSVQKAYYYVKDLDSGLNDIQIVTEKSANEMARFAEQANNAAKSLATTTADYTEGALIYYQQGLDDETVKTLTDITAKTSNVTGQGMQAVSEQLTAVWNGYQVANEAAAEGMQVYEEYVDKMAAVGAATASDLEELATAMSKVASAANAMGVDFDQLSAQIATIVSVTRQAPESVGTALKTIYARIGDLKMDGVDEFGVTLGEVSGQLEQVGIQVMDQSGNLRDVGMIMEEVAAKWGTWNEAQQQSIAIAIAGKRQYNNLLALFENWDMYTDTLNTAANAAGTLDKQQNIALESLKNKLEKLSATAEDLYDSLFDEQGLKDLIDFITPIVQGVVDITDGLGGLNTILPLVIGNMTKLFSAQIANGIIPMVNNLQTFTGKDNGQQKRQELATYYQTQMFSNPEEFVLTEGSGLTNAQKDMVIEMSEYYEKMSKNIDIMTDEQVEYYHSILDSKKAIIDADIELEKLKQDFEALVDTKKGRTLKDTFGDIINNEDVSRVQEIGRILNTIKAKDYKTSKTNKQHIATMVGDEAADLYEANLEKIMKKQGKGLSDAVYVDLQQALQQTIDEAYAYADKKAQQFEVEAQKAIIEEKVKVDEKGLDEQLNLQKATISITNAVGALTQLGSAISMVQNLGAIFTNEDLEPMDKFIQILSNMTFFIPTVLLALKTLNTEFGLGSFLSAAFALAQTKLGIAMGGGAAATSAAAFAQEGYNAALLASPLAPYVLALGVLIAVIGATVAIYDALTVSAEEASEQLTDSIQKYKNTESELNSLNNELDTTTNRLKELYAIADEDLTIADKNEIAVLEAQNAALAAQIELKKQKLDLEQKKIVDKGIQALNEGSFDVEDFTMDDRSGGFKSYFQENNIDWKTFKVSDIEAYNKFLEDYAAAEAEYKTTGKSMDISLGGAKMHINTIRGMKDIWDEQIEEYKQDLPQQYNQALETLPSFYAQNTSGQYDKQIKELESVVKNYYEINGQMKSLSENILNNSFDNQEQLVAVLNNSLDKESGIINKDAFINALNGMGQNGTEVYNELLIASQTLGISMYDLLDAAERYNIQIAGEGQIENSIYSVSLEKVNLLISALENLQSGTALTEEEIAKLEGKYSELSKIWDKSSYDYMQALNQILEMEEEAVTTKLKENVGLAWEEASSALGKYTKDVEYLDDLYDKVNAPDWTGGTPPNSFWENYAEESIGELDQSLKELFETQYQLEISITDDIVSDAENLITSIENVATATSLIGDGFKIAAEDAEKLFDIYPELASQAQILADGTIQLNSTVVDNTLSGYAEIIDGDKEVTAQNIKDRIDELEAKKITVKGQIEAVQNSTDIQTDLNNILGENSEGWYKYEAELDADLAADEVFNSGKSAEAIIDNWAAKEKAAMDYAATAKEAEAAGHETNGPRVDGSNYNVRTQAETQNTTGENSSDNITAQTEEELRQNVLDYLNNLYDSYEGQIADLTVLYSQIFSSTDKVGKKESSSKEDKRELKEYMDEFDRYWTINKAIEKVTESLSDLDKVQSHLFGKELIANLQQQNALLDEQANKYETLFSMQQQEAAELQTALRGFGVAFDAAGGVSNYAAVTQAMLNAYNIEAISEEGYEQFKKLLERYEELFYGEMVDVQNQLDDIYYEQLANNLEAWEVEIELNFELNEAEREWSDFLKEINDDFKATYRDIGKEFANIFEHLDTYSRSGGTIATNIQALKDVQDAIATMQAGGSSDMFASVSEAEEKAKELKETLMEDVESVHGLWVNAWDAYMEGIDQASSKFDDLMSKFETIDEELEYQGELIELLYGTQAYDLMNSLYDAQISNSLAQVDSLKQQADMWKELYDNAEEGSEEQTKYYEEWQEAQDNLNNSVIEHINLLKKDYNNALDKIIDNLEKELTGGLGLDEMRENWEEATAAAEKYYDATERIYELETLENKFQEAINNTSSLENQQKLKALIDDQLADLKAKEKLTEYDITLAEKRLEIAQAEMALEDARNAKNSMKLVRGANGNWEYQYVADEDDIAAKQQEMLDAYNNLYQFVKETQQESIESILNMTEQFFTKMNEIRNDDTLNEEQKMLKMEELREQYYGENGKITILQAEHAKYTEDLNIANAELLWGLYKADETNYGLMTEAQKVLIDDFINHSIEDYYALDQYITGTYDELQGKLEESTSESLITWNSAAAEMADAWNADDGVSVKAQVTEAFEEMQSALEEYEEGIETLEDTADTSFDNLVTDIESAIDATNDLKDATADLCDESIDALNDYKSKINEVEDAWYDVRDAVNAAMNAVGEANNSSSTNNANPTITPTAPGGGGGSGSGGGDGGSGSGGGDGGSENGGAKGEGLPTGELFVPEDEEVSDQPLFTKGQKIASAEQRRDGGVNTVRYWTWDGANMNSDQWTDFQFGSSLEGKTIAKQPKKYNGIWYYKIPFSTDKGNNWFREGQLVAYDTGGYTGDWSSRDGKLAMLHEKELVLNADDTKNILEVVQLTRDMASLTSSVGSAVMDGVKMMLYDLMGMKAPGNNMVMTPQVADGDNIFNITAEFPNANDVTSIREAILSLPNMASQYLSQNKK